MGFLRSTWVILAGLLVFSSAYGIEEEEKEKPDSTGRITSNAVETPDREVSEVATTESEKTAEEAIVFSDAITEFEENTIPVDSATFFNHVNSLEFQISLDYNSEVKRFINFFGTEWQSKLKQMITLSDYYFPIYESVFDKHNLPLELKYVSVIESALNPYATSRSGAVGLWQFMPYTGKLYDLKIDRYQDERRDIVKSTNAAAGYFKDMSLVFDDWLVVIASYNCGPGNIRKAIRRAGGKTGFWDIYPYLPSQTQNYIPSFIAVAYLMNFYEHYGIFPSMVDMPDANLTKVTCTPNHNLKAMSEVLDIPVETIRSLNPCMKSDNIPSNVKTFEIALPHSAAYCFIEKENDILTLSESYKPAVTEVVYVVRRGDSLQAIANRKGCSVSEIKEWNNLRSNMIHPGNKLTLYL